MTLIIFLNVVIRALLTCVILQFSFAMMTRWERRAMARMQWRIGPNRVGPAGLFQPFADGIKLLFKEQLLPDQAKPFIFLLAPVLSLIVALTSFAVIPVQLSNWPLDLFFDIPTIPNPDPSLPATAMNQFQLADIDVGVLFLLGVTSLAVYGIVLGGWASGNKYSLIGAIRATAQMVSYELALGTALLSPLFMVGSLSFRDISIYQDGSAWLFMSQPLVAIIFAISALAETNRAPFDLPEAEQELGAGFHTEYSGMRFSLFFMAEYTAMMTVSAVLVTVFFGGARLIPFYDGAPESIIIFILKIMACMFCFIWIRATFPRFRFDQLMNIGWKVLLPLAMMNLAITAVGVVFQLPWWGYTLTICGTVGFLYVLGKLGRRQEADAH